ncbi:MAG: hypothetical protein JWM17_914 [Actinobacteria bacterium]|nr:hypothetical protein [Actinomycetota bacterium]
MAGVQTRAWDCPAASSCKLMPPQPDILVVIRVCPSVAVLEYIPSRLIPAVSRQVRRAPPRAATPPLIGPSYLRR